MGFDRKEVAKLLVKCHRRCCICHRFCGSKMETDHMVQLNDGGTHDIENAIPVCFDCHAEIHHYNNQHPKGRKFTPEEMKGHKKQWLKICEERPDIVAQPSNSDFGYLVALADEIQFNETLTVYSSDNYFCKFNDEQFRRSINAGMLSLLPKDLKESIFKAYQTIGKINHMNKAISHKLFGGIFGLPQSVFISKEIRVCGNLLEKARIRLTNFLRPHDST